MTKSTKQALYDIYRRDFELFGYDAEQYFLWTGLQSVTSQRKSLHGHKNNSVKKKEFWNSESVRSTRERFDKKLTSENKNLISIGKRGQRQRVHFANVSLKSF